MKMSKLRLLHFAVIAAATLLFVIQQQGASGRLRSAFLQNTLYPPLRRIAAAFTDAKFRIRGELPKPAKVAVVAIDNHSLARIGRWPWRREVLAYLIERVFQRGARTVGLDIILSESEQRIPVELAEILKRKKLGSLLSQFDTDSMLAGTVANHAGHLVLSWAADVDCRPLYSPPEECPVTDPKMLTAFPGDLTKFMVPQLAGLSDAHATPVPSAVSILANLPILDRAARQEGFANSFPDPDGAIRRTGLLMIAGGKPYPSMPLELARLHLGEDALAEFDGSRVRSLTLSPSGRSLPVNAAGASDINFYGPDESIARVSASDVMYDKPERAVAAEGATSGASVDEALKDAAVVIGVTALAEHDIRATPFDSHVPGAEVQATILANILSDTLLDSGNNRLAFVLLLLVMTLGALAFERCAERWEARPALVLFGYVFLALFVVDTRLFENGRNWNTSLLYIEWISLAVLTLITKYVREEQKKKFLRTAFSKYLSPAVVDTLISDPSKLSLGGTKRKLTVLFSDIRGFTTISESMDPARLSEMLNQYFGMMTRIVFEHRGTFDKYVGDALMAFWGAPLDDPSQAANALESARAMLSALAARREDFRRRFGHEIRIGIGIHAGTASVGNMGSEMSFGYTAIGDDVNLASRLESATKIYGAGILTSRATFDAILAAGGSLPPHRVLDRVIVKGRTQAVEIIEVAGDSFDPQGLSRFAEARTCYQERRWRQAIGLFHAALERMPGDVACRTFVERCQRLEQSPPPPEWDGSWSLDGH